MRKLLLSVFGTLLTGTSVVFGQSGSSVPSVPSQTITIPNNPYPVPPPPVTLFQRISGDNSASVAVPVPSGAAAAAAPPVVLDSSASEQCGTCCGEGNILQFRADYLLWWINKGPLPVPIATGDRTNAAANGLTSAGLIDPNTFVFIGDSSINYGAQSGARLFADLALAGNWSIEAGGFLLAQKTNNQSVSSNSAGLPVILRPFITAAQTSILPDGGSGNDGLLIAYSSTDPNIEADDGHPGVPDHSFAGGLLMSSKSSLWGAEANLARHLFQDGRWQMDALVGLRFLDLRESIAIESAGIFLVDGTGTFQGNFIGPGTQYTSFDSFGTENQFYGGQVGARFVGQFGRFSLAGSLKLALGDTHEVVQRNGSESVIPAANSGPLVAGVLTVAPGGELVPPSSIGTQSHDAFAIVPELNFEIGFDLTSYLRLSVGYDLLYWTQVARPGNQISLLVNDTQTPLSPRFGETDFPQNLGYPFLPFLQSAFWAQGIHFGAELRY